MPLSPQAKVSTAKKVKAKVFVLDAGATAKDMVIDPEAFKKYLSERIKVNKKAGALGADIAVAVVDGSKVTVSAKIPFSKRYLKYRECSSPEQQPSADRPCRSPLTALALPSPPPHPPLQSPRST